MLHHGVSNLQRSLENLRRPEHHQHHRPKMLPLCQLLQNPDQVDTTEQIPPTVPSVRRRTLRNVRHSLSVLRIEHAVGEVETGEIIPRGNVLTDVLIEELEDERDAVGEDEVLAHILKLVDVVDLEVLEEEKESGGDCLHDDFLMTIDINRYLQYNK